MEDWKPICIPMVTNCRLSKYDESLELNQSMYHSMIINLFYVIASTPGIMQYVGLGSRLQANSNEMHLNVVKLIFKYLQGTHDYGLWCPKNKHFNLITFTNLILLVVLMTTKVLQEQRTFWEIVWSLWKARSKIVSLCI